VAPRSEDPKLIVRVINVELVQFICPRYTNVTDRRSDRRTDGRTTSDINTALVLRAQRGKNSPYSERVKIVKLPSSKFLRQRGDMIAANSYLLVHMITQLPQYSHFIRVSYQREFFANGYSSLPF